MNKVDNLFRQAWTLQKLEMYDSAVAAYQRILELDPSHVPSWTNLGGIYHLQKKDYGKAKEYAWKAIELRPANAQLWFNYATMLNEAMDLAGAIEHYRHAISLDPNHADAHWNLAHALLLSGQYAEGWEEYEWGWKKLLRTPVLHEHIPRWEGENLRGKSILLWAEQGFGDTIQFLRYVRQVQFLCDDVTVEVPKELYLLVVERLEVKVKERGVPAQRDFDYQCPLMSLPWALGAFQPVLMPAYLKSVKDPLLRVRSVQPKIGLAWSGSTSHPSDARRSIPLEKIKTILSPDAFYLSLHREFRVGEESGLLPIANMSRFLTDFHATAELIQQLDLVITVDTVAAHLAGALGVPTWLMLPFEPDWRWGAKGPQSWYRSVEVFRQTKRDNWDSVLQEVKDRQSIWLKEMPMHKV